MDAELAFNRYYTPAGSIHEDAQSVGSRGIHKSKAQLHYQYVVRYLPIFVIFIPSLLSLFFPQVIRIGVIQIGNESSNPSSIMVDLFCVLTICWIVKFLLDWPWKWYLQITDLKLRLGDCLDSKDEKLLDATRESISLLNRQQGISFLSCIVSPFICWSILLMTRERISSGKIFSDLNIGIFVGCGLIRVIIQASEHVQRSTAAIELKTEKLMQQNAHQRDQTFLEIDSTDLLMRMERLELMLSQTNGKLDLIYSKNKFNIDNGLSFLSSKHFKILEKEVNELNLKLEAQTSEFDHLLGQIQAPPEQKQRSSLHGAPITKHPTYLRSQGQLPMEKLFEQESPMVTFCDYLPALKEQGEKDMFTHFIWFMATAPLSIHKTIWTIVGFVPTRILKAVYWMVLMVLDVLLELTRDKTRD